MLTETWLNSNIRENEIFDLSNQFHFYRRDRETRQGGGVLIAIKKEFESFALHIASCLEIIWVSVKLAHCRMVVGVCYRPPNDSSTFVTELYDAINIVITRYPTSPVFLLGDFNYPGIKWSTSPPSLNSSSSVCQEFIELCSYFHFTQIISEPTRVTPTSANLLDLVLTTCPELCSEVTYMPKISDHSLLNFSVTIPVKKFSNRTKVIRNYPNADFNQINDELFLFLQAFLNGFEARSVEYNWKLLKTKMTELANRFIPVRVICYNPQAPWYNSFIRRLSNRKKRMYRSAKTSSDQHRWSLYRTSADEYNSAVKSAKENFLTNTLPNMLLNNPRKFWNVVNPADSSRIVLTNLDGEPIDDKQCSDTLNNVFSSAFSCVFSDVLPSFSNPEYLPMYPVQIETDGIAKIIDSLKPFSSSGVDCITPMFLKKHESLYLCRPR